jgi:hypothetical protein
MCLVAGGVGFLPLVLSQLVQITLAFYFTLCGHGIWHGAVKWNE